MQAQPTPNAQPQFPIQELEQIESAIQTSQRWIATLQGRRDVLTAELDRLTRPLPAAARAPQQSTIVPGLEFRGVMTKHWNYIDIHIDLLRRLWTEFPDKRETMAQAMGRYGATRAYVAKSHAELFPGQSATWAQPYSRPLVHSWYTSQAAA